MEKQFILRIRFMPQLGNIIRDKHTSLLFTSVNFVQGFIVLTTGVECEPPISQMKIGNQKKQPILTVMLADSIKPPNKF
jgi:hypothetical protein